MHYAKRIVMKFGGNHREGDLAFFDRLQLEAEQAREWRCRCLALRDGHEVFDATHPARRRHARLRIVPGGVSRAIHEGDKIPSFRRRALDGMVVTHRC